jgi:heterodisulfide reductase subunit A-like polyferredoxin
MVVLAPHIEPFPGTDKLAELLNVQRDEHGFIETNVFDPVSTTRPGIIAIGCAQGPQFMNDVTLQAHIAAGQVLSFTED